MSTRKPRSANFDYKTITLDMFTNAKARLAAGAPMAKVAQDLGLPPKIVKEIKEGVITAFDRSFWFSKDRDDYDNRGSTPSALTAEFYQEWLYHSKLNIEWRVKGPKNMALEVLSHLIYLVSDEYAGRLDERIPRIVTLLQTLDSESGR
jgi:hypothetical protein